MALARDSGTRGSTPKARPWWIELVRLWLACLGILLWYAVLVLWSH